MKTKNTIVTILMATTLVFTGNVNAAELATEKAEDTVSAVENKDGSFAFTKAPELKEKDETSVTLTWEELPNALGYVVSYGDESVEKSKGLIKSYKNEVADLIEATEHKIEGLEAGKTYYFAVMALDKNLQETEYSPELEVALETNTPIVEEKAAEPKTEEVTSKSPVEEQVKEEVSKAPVSLAITNVEVPYSNEIKVTFNKVLNNDANATREFIVVDKISDEEVIISETSLENENKTVVLTMADELSGNAEYGITVIALEAQDGTNIEAGVEGTRSFTAPVALTLKTKETPVMEEVVEPQDVELNAAGPAKVEAKNLPQTGAEEVVVLFLAMVLTGMIFMRRKA